MRMDAMLKASAARNEALPSIAVIEKEECVHCCFSYWYTIIRRLCELSTAQWPHYGRRDWVSYDGIGKFTVLVGGRAIWVRECAQLRLVAIGASRIRLNELAIGTRYMLFKSWYMSSHVFSGARTLCLTKKIYALYKVIISANTIDINVFEMIYTTAGGSCKRHRMYLQAPLRANLR